MKTTITLLIIILVNGSTIFSQGSATRNVEPFTKIEVRNGISVELVKSDKESVEIKTQSLDISSVITQVNNGTLSIKTDGPSGTNKITVRIFYRNIEEIRGYGNSQIYSTSLMKQDMLTVELETGADAYLDLDIKNLKSRLTEGSILSAEGYAVTHEGYATTGAVLSLFELESEDVTVKVTGSGKAKLNVENSLTADASSGGYVAFKGNPAKKDFKTSLGGKIEPSEE